MERTWPTPIKPTCTQCKLYPLVRIGCAKLRVGSASFFLYQYVGIPNAKFSRWGSRPTRRVFCCSGIQALNYCRVFSKNHIWGPRKSSLCCMPPNYPCPMSPLGSSNVTCISLEMADVFIVTYFNFLIFSFIYIYSAVCNLTLYVI